MLQSNPNGGLLTPIGLLGVDTSSLVGVDISGLSGIAYAAFTAPGAASSQLCTINLANGSATLVGTIGGGTTVRGLAAPIGTAAVPEPATVALVGSGALWISRRARRRRP